MDIIETLDTLIERAIELRASDIHIESAPEAFQVRFRIDGLLHADQLLEKETGTHIISRIKVLAHLDVAERRIPQDGKYAFSAHKGWYDIRVTTFPSVHGEKVVLRILERSHDAQHELDRLGFTEEMLSAIRQIMQAASGFFLVTGPTGSGKTTTLHALLSALKSPEKNTVTLEDPVEYMIEGVTQTQVHPEIGFTFAQGLRSLLRADPDTIMVGEMRDRETAQVALQAALTGHFVMSTLHTIDAPSALLRLRDMGLEPFLINASVTAVLAQRLVRKLCSHCRTISPLSLEHTESLARLGIALIQLYTATGCDHCRHTGYHGRTGVFQLLIMSHSLRTLFVQQPDHTLLHEKAGEEGMRSLAHDAAYKLEKGITSLAEVVRVLS